MNDCESVISSLLWREKEFSRNFVILEIPMKKDEDRDISFVDFGYYQQRKFH